MKNRKLKIANDRLTHTKLKESEKGITLIALVITIIVLLILAAVSIAMLTGENGILSKASTAKEKHLIAQYEEELNLCIMEMQTDELGTLTMPKLKEDIESNTTFKYEVTDLNGNTETKTAQVTNIDKTDPSECKIEAKVNDDGAIEVTATAVDAESGIGRYECYVNEEKKGESTDGTFKIENLASGTYSVYVKAYDKAGNNKQSNTLSDLKISAVMNNITAQMVAEHPETYYGLKVTNYTSKNGQNDWRIFYSDGEHIFLITGGYVDLSTANEGTTKLNSNTGMAKVGTKYRANWSSAPSSLQAVEDTVKTRFMTTGYTLNSSNLNSKCVSTLLNASNWESYKDNNEMAEYAVGGSTIEMWMDSWNKLCDRKYNKPSDKLYCNNTNSNGYYVGTSSNPTSAAISSSVMSAKDGYNNSLYYPHHASISDGDGNYDYCDSYWLASPAANSSYNVLNVHCNGYVYSSIYNDTNMGVRPVVSLNSGIKVNATDAE